MVGVRPKGHRPLQGLVPTADRVVFHDVASICSSPARVLPVNCGRSRGLIPTPCTLAVRAPVLAHSARRLPIPLRLTSDLTYVLVNFCSVLLSCSRYDCHHHRAILSYHLILPPQLRYARAQFCILAVVRPPGTTRAALGLAPACPHAVVVWTTGS